MNIIGHSATRKKLLSRVGEKNLPQSYLFTGPRSVGKRLCAEEFAAHLVGEPGFEASEGKLHPYDVLILHPESVIKRGVTKTQGISAQAVRQAATFLTHFPAQGNFRVVIIEEAERLTLTAQNALLKILEEPHPTAILILVTHAPGTLLATVRSRVHPVKFHFVPEAIMREGLAASFGAEALSQIAPFFFALGRPGMLVSALAEPERFASEREKLSQLFRLSTLSVSERLGLAEQLALETDETIRLLEWWLPGLHAQALKTTERQITRTFFGLLEEVENTLGLLKTTQSNPRLLLERLFFSL